VNARPQTLAALGRIEGFGKAKLEKYGAEMLAVLKQAPQYGTASGSDQVQPVAPAAVDRVAIAARTAPEVNDERTQ
jgi:hypothetical protein